MAVPIIVSITNATDLRAAAQTNFEEMAESLAFKLNPTNVGIPPAANTIVGPPDSGTWTEGEIWVDSLCAKWRCTVAGTTGTWQQITPAFVATADRPVTPPDDYWIRDTDEHFKEYYWNDGGSAWAAV